MRRTKQNEQETTWKHPELFKNLGVAASLVICAVTLRCGAIPGAQQATDAVLDAMTGDTLLNDRLGRLTFVSKLFPEATLVFGEGNWEPVIPPMVGEAVHAWSESEPYMAWHGEEAQPIRAALDGEVTEIRQTAQGEKAVLLRDASGRMCMYGNLTTVSVREGDAVSAGETIGTLGKGQDIYFELRDAGRSVDPAAQLAVP